MVPGIYADLFDDHLTGVADKLDEPVGQNVGKPHCRRPNITPTGVYGDLGTVPPVGLEPTLGGF